MTDRKWRIINGKGKNDFYNKVEKYEKRGYILMTNSFSYSGMGNQYVALMKNKNIS